MKTSVPPVPDLVSNTANLDPGLQHDLVFIGENNLLEYPLGFQCHVAQPHIELQLPHDRRAGSCLFVRHPRHYALAVHPHTPSQV